MDFSANIGRLIKPFQFIYKLSTLNSSSHTFILTVGFDDGDGNCDPLLNFAVSIGLDGDNGGHNSDLFFNFVVSKGLACDPLLHSCGMLNSNSSRVLLEKILS